MSKKKERAWFISPQWGELIPRHYPNDESAAHALRTNPKVLARIRQQMPVARSTLVKLLRRFGEQHSIGAPADQLIVDIRSH
jgi:hypothetical protein